MNRTLLFAAFVFVTLLFGCSNDEPTPSSPQAAIIDPALVGDWVELDTTVASSSAPRSINGIRILPDGNVYRLGVELSSGKLAIRPIGNAAKVFKYLVHGYWESLEFIAPSIEIFSGSYSYRGDTLRMKVIEGQQSMPRLNATYVRVSVGSIVAEPINIQFSARVRGGWFQVSQIYSQPSAYAKFDFDHDTSRLVIYGFFEHSDYQENAYIELCINNVGATGTFDLSQPITKRFGFYGENHGDVFPRWTSESGLVSITKLDFQNARCEGTFEFRAKFRSYIPDVLITDGKFSVPLYK